MDNGPINVRRLSLPAYNTAVGSARAEPSGLTGTSSATGEVDAWAELEESGLARDGHLTPEWTRALAGADRAPVTITLAARHDRMVFDTDVALLPGLGLTVTQRSVVGDEPSETLHEPVVELVAFSPDLVWPVVRRVLPPQEAVRADPRPTPPSQRRTIGADDAARESVLAGGDAQVSLLVSIHTPEGTAPFGLHRWVLVDDDLYEVNGTDPEVVAVQPGAIAHELVYLVTGAYSAAATGFDSAVR